MKYSYGLENIKVRHWGEDADVQIGSFCSIADNVEIFLGGNHRTDWVTTYPFGHINQDKFPWHGKGHPATKGNVVIGNDVWIGSGAVLFSGINIGDGAVIAAKSVVTKDVPAYSVVGGNPASVLKWRFTGDQIEKLLKNPWWELPEARINDLIPLLCSNDVEALIAAVNA